MNCVALRGAVLASATLSAIAIAGFAQAADVKAAPAYKAPAAIAPMSWTGFYTGLGLGSRTTRTDVTTTSAIVNGAPLDLPSLASSLPFDGTAFRASPYLGFNWQIAPRWVVGAEGDFGFARQTTTRSGFESSPAVGSLFSDTNDGFETKTTWDASLRGRLGFLLTPATMGYATGGIAWQHYSVSSACVGSICSIFQFAPAAVTGTATNAGWTLGGGLETALWGHWLARAEYRYADFGTSAFTISRSNTFGVGPDNFDTKLRTHTATFGLAYKFGNPVAPDSSGDALAAFAMKRASKTSSWGGPYAGLGLGARMTRADLTTVSEVINIPRSLGVAPVGQSFDDTGFRSSAFAGYNWQFAPRWVAGIEGEVGFADETSKLAGFSFSPGTFQTTESPDSLAVHLDWDGSLRGRLGFLLNPATLVYAAAGPAWQHFDVTSTCAGPNCQTGGQFTPAIVSNSTTKAGWTAGGGIEAAVGGPWLVRAEYRYADLGTMPFTISRASPIGAINPTIDNFDVKMRTHTVTFGLAYKFN